MPDANLTPTERAIVDHARDPAGDRNPARTIIITAVVTIGLLIAAMYQGFGAKEFGWLAVAYVAVTSLDRLRHAGILRRYREVIRKLAEAEEGEDS